MDIKKLYDDGWTLEEIGRNLTPKISRQAVHKRLKKLGCEFRHVGPVSHSGGAYKLPSGRYRARTMISGKRYDLGTHKSKEEAKNIVLNFKSMA